MPHSEWSVGLTSDSRTDKIGVVVRELYAPIGLGLRLEAEGERTAGPKEIAEALRGLADELELLG